MKTYKKHLILCLFIIFVFHTACYNLGRTTPSGIEEFNQIGNSKYGEFVLVQLNNGRKVFGYLKNVNNVNLTLECHDYEKLFSVLTKNNMRLKSKKECPIKLEGTGNTIVIGYKDIKAVIIPQTNKSSSTYMNWFYVGEKILVILKNGSKKRGAIISNKIKGIELFTKNYRILFLKWADIYQIRIIKKSLIENILKKSFCLLLAMIGFCLVYIIFLTPRITDLPLR